MNNICNIKWTPRSVQDAQTFFEKHGNSLSEVLHVFGGDSALDLFCDANRLLEGLDPNHGQVGETLKKILNVLKKATGYDVRYDAALRWHGARISDLASRMLQ